MFRQPETRPYPPEFPRVQVSDDVLNLALGQHKLIQLDAFRVVTQIEDPTRSVT